MCLQDDQSRYGGCSLPTRKYVLIVADYSQIELKVLAHYSRDPTLLRAYKEGLDVHAVTASKVLSIPMEDVTPEQRGAGKTTSFLTVYGGGYHKLATQQGISLRAAKKFLAGHRAEFPRIYSWKQDVVVQCKRNRVTTAQAAAYGGTPQPPHVLTILGRKRRLPGILFQDSELRGYAERQAVNALIQGSAADIQKLAMVRYHRLTKNTAHNLLLTVHDELVVSVPAREVDQGVAWIKEAMEGVELPEKLRVPLTVDVKVCDSWAEAKG